MVTTRSYFHKVVDFSVQVVLLFSNDPMVGGLPTLRTHGEEEAFSYLIVPL
jgi:hypothetical protein